MKELILQFLTDNWETISAILVGILYEVTARWIPTVKNRSIIDNLAKFIGFILKNRRKPSTTDKVVEKNKNQVTVDQGKHIISILILFALSFPSVAQQGWQNFKGIRLVNQLDSTTVLTVDGTIYYNDQSDKFRALQNGVWYDLIGGGGGGSYTFSEGLTETGGAVTWGGVITSTRTFNATDASLIFEGSGTSAYSNTNENQIRNAISSGTDSVSVRMYYNDPILEPFNPNEKSFRSNVTSSANFGSSQIFQWGPSIALSATSVPHGGSGTGSLSISSSEYIMSVVDGSFTSSIDANNTFQRHLMTNGTDQSTYTMTPVGIAFNTTGTGVYENESEQEIRHAINDGSDSVSVRLFNDVGNEKKFVTTVNLGTNSSSITLQSSAAVISGSDGTNNGTLQATASEVSWSQTNGSNFAFGSYSTSGISNNITDGSSTSTETLTAQEYSLTVSTGSGNTYSSTWDTGGILTNRADQGIGVVEEIFNVGTVNAVYDLTIYSGVSPISNINIQQGDIVYETQEDFTINAAQSGAGNVNIRNNNGVNFVNILVGTNAITLAGNDGSTNGFIGVGNGGVSIAAGGPAGDVELSTGTSQFLMQATTQDFIFSSSAGADFTIDLNTGFIMLPGLPTSCAGVPTSGIANVAGVLTVCP